MPVQEIRVEPSFIKDDALWKYFFWDVSERMHDLWHTAFQPLIQTHTNTGNCTQPFLCLAVLCMILEIPIILEYC